MVTDFFDIFVYILRESAQTLFVTQFLQILLILFLFVVVFKWLRF